MTALLRRLVHSLAAYQLADLVSKCIAVLLLRVYTRYISQSGYGEVELLANGVIFVSILVRFGMIEAFLRYHFAAGDRARRDALARRAVGFLLLTTSVAAAGLALAAAPLSRLVLGHRDVPIFLVAVLGLWAFTNLELAYGLLRVEERLRAYAVASVANVLVTVASSLVLVVALHQGARGLLLGNYATSAIVLLGLWFSLRHRLLGGSVPAAQRLGELLRFGLPTVPAELSVYGLSIVDRVYVYHDRSPAQAGLYSIAVKLAGTVAFIVRAFQYAWPPLAYSISDDAQAARFYGLVTTYYVALSGWVVAGLTLLGRWVLRLLTDPRFHGLEAFRAVPWVALGWALYGLWVVFLVIAGRVGVTRRNFPAAAAGLATNVVLILLLVGPLGIAGAGIALCGAYVVMLAVMHLLTRRAFTVEFEWARLAQAAGVSAGIALAGELLLPTHGLAGFASRVIALALIPVCLLAVRFLTPRELAGVSSLWGKLIAGRARGRAR